jgi:UDP-glucose 4-epimerase
VNCWSLLANDISKQAMKNKEIKIYNTTLLQRDFIAISEVCRSICHLITSNQFDYCVNIYNLGSGKSLSIYQLAKLVSDRCQVNFNFLPPIYHKFSEKYEFPLRFSIEKIENTGLTIGKNLNDEIDSLLEFCRVEF